MTASLYNADILRLAASIPHAGRLPATRALAHVAIEVERVDFVSVPIRDRARARRFYGDLLGLPPGGPAPDEFEAANVTLALWAPEEEDLLDLAYGATRTSRLACQIRLDDALDGLTVRIP